MQVQFGLWWLFELLIVFYVNFIDVFANSSDFLMQVLTDWFWISVASVVFVLFSHFICVVQHGRVHSVLLLLPKRFYPEHYQGKLTKCDFFAPCEIAQFFPYYGIRSNIDTINIMSKLVYKHSDSFMVRIYLRNCKVGNNLARLGMCTYCVSDLIPNS